MGNLYEWQTSLRIEDNNFLRPVGGIVGSWVYVEDVTFEQVEIHRPVKLPCLAVTINYPLLTSLKRGAVCHYLTVDSGRVADDRGANAFLCFPQCQVDIATLFENGRVPLGVGCAAKGPY